MAFGEPCAGKPLARFDEEAAGSIPVLYSTESHAMIGDDIRLRDQCRRVRDGAAESRFD
jgi:hypothetical protein